ncbi:neurogenic locus notch homolog protein 1-like [Uloborus diversus]|uniref:neurogenic locus notch homolog protein 1-like n=1 Tax=Uloborus diversus TaxID=327109 RepID=UPI0024099331|nr:neurogenic locus notch homolog protein 1-like [Uloborus diversus]
MDDEAICKYNIEEQEPYCDCEDENQVYIEKNRKCRTTCSDDDDERSCKFEAECEETEKGHFCSCPKGTSGDFCEKVDKCQNKTELWKLCGKSKNVKCSYNVENKDAYCFCDDESQKFNEATKKCTTTCDADTACFNKGTCPTTEDPAFCKCGEGFSGDRCEVIDVCTGENPLCGDEKDVDCVYDAETDKPVCKCKEGKEFDYTTKTCREQCDKVTKPCQNEMACLPDEQGKNFCQCNNTLSGDFCDTVNACKVKDFCGTGSGVDCVYDSNSETNAACKCQDTSKKFDSTLKMCRETCVNDSVCEYGSLCVEESSSKNKFCRCRDGLSGDFCNVISDCEKVCGSGDDVSCVFNVTNGKVNCNCMIETKRFDKVTKMCRVPCNGTDCKSDSTCRRYSNDPERDDSDITNDDATFCRCWPGTRGDFCEKIDDCVNGKVDCGDDEGAVCVYSHYNYKGYCTCPEEKKEYDTITKKCLDCDCGPLAQGCYISEGKKGCNCMDRAYEKDNYCYGKCKQIVLYRCIHSFYKSYY